MENVNDDVSVSPKQKKQRMDEKEERSSNKFSLFSGRHVGLHGVDQAQFSFPLSSMRGITNSSTNYSNSGCGVSREKVGEPVLVNMHKHGIMGMQRSMKESADVAFFNQGSIIKHAFKPSSPPMTLQTLVFMSNGRLQMLEEEDSTPDVKAQILAGLMVDLLNSLQIVACGWTWCRFEQVGLVMSRAHMLDDPTKSISTLLAEAGMFSAIQQSQSNSSTVYGGFKGPRKMKKKRKGVCFKFRDEGTCMYGNKCKYSHDLAESGKKKDDVE